MIKKVFEATGAGIQNLNFNNFYKVLGGSTLEAILG